MEKSFVFNSINGDRRYKAEDFREYFASFIGNGVFPNPSTNLQIIANSNMTITIKVGKGWINGALYENTTDYIIKIEPADGVLNRIDRVVLRFDNSERNIHAYIKKGTFSSTAIAPTLQRDADAYELALADIKVDKGTISITQANITDLRQNKNYCGIVHGTIEQIDVTTLFNQYAARLEEKELGFEEEFKIWFETIKGQLSGDVAGNLAMQIEANKEKIEGLEKDVGASLEEIAKEQEKVFQSVSNGKSTVASAITDKGVNTLATDSFNTMANNIKNIKTGYEKGDTIESNRLEIRYNYNLPLCKLFAYNYGSFNNFTMNLSNDGKYIFMKYNTNTSSTYVNIYNVNSREIISGKYITSSTSNYYSYFDDINNIYISTYKTASEFEIYLCDLLNPGVNKKIFSINISDVNSNIYGFFDNKNKYIYISIINKYTIKIDYNGNKISEVSNELITEISNNAIGKIFAQDDYVYIFYKYNTVKIKKISTGEIVNTLELDNYFEYIKWHNNYIYVISRNANIIKKYKIENGISLISSRSIPSSINYLRWSIDPLNENIISDYLTDVGNSQYHVLKFHSSINVSCYKDWELKLADLQMHFKPCYLNIIDNNIFIGSHKDFSSRSEDFHHYCLYPDISSVKIKEEKLI